MILGFNEYLMHFPDSTNILTNIPRLLITPPFFWLHEITSIHSEKKSTDKAPAN
jgi:hypothetical protein